MTKLLPCARGLKHCLPSAPPSQAVCLAATLLLLGLACAPAFASDAPQWLRQAASSSQPAYDKRVAAVVLLNEQSVKVEDDGRMTMVARYAVRILSAEGRGEARGSVSYLTGTGKVRDMRAWMIRPSGEVKRYGKDRVQDLAAAPNDVYNESRIKSIQARDDAEPGAVFGYEATSEDRSVFTQFDWQFQGRLPVLLSRFTLALPENWRAEGVTFNHSPIAPSVSAATYCWELRDLPYIHDEPASPPVTNLAARLAVSYFPAPGAKAAIGRVFADWADVSRWLTELSEPQATLNQQMVSKARQLVAGAKSELERIRAIARYVQNVNYISIQTGLGRGGGYRPHSAIEVFAKSYGDCKDKANLMRAMLRAVNIDSHLVAIYSGDPTYVRQEWPSPQQFNHCIIAVKVSEQTHAPTVVSDAALGRMLMFDPTDDNTPVGDLPDHEQGSLALVVAGDAGRLLRMPSTPPEANSLERQAEVVLEADGSVSVSVRERAAGQSAASSRRAFRGLSRPEFAKMIEAWITEAATGAKLLKVEPRDNSLEGRFDLDIEFEAERYAQLMQGRLLVFKPAIVARRDSLLLIEAERRNPVVLEPQAYTETVRVKLPAGFEVDELPEPSELAAPFGAYSASYEMREGHLHFTRRLLLKGMTLGVEQYAAVRGFFERMRAAEQSPVVLARR